MLTEDQVRQILDELPEREPRSRLDPFRELIVEMRRRQYSYRDISRFLTERCSVAISHNAVRNFINRRCSGVPESPSLPASDRETAPSSTAVQASLSEEPKADQAHAIRERIAALKGRSQTDQPPEAGFRFDPAQPLRLPDE